MKYLPLFRLRIRHGYYISGQCTDIRVEPSAAGARLLKNYRLIWKPLPDGLVVFAPTNGAGELFIPVPQVTCLEFHLLRNNKDFDLFTEFTEPGGWARVNRPVYRNIPADVSGGELVLDPGVGNPVRGVFAHVEICGMENGWLSQGSVDFSIRFQPKQARWVYYLVTDRNNGEDEPLIEDPDGVRAGSPLSFDAEELSGSDSSLHSEDSVADWLAIQYPGHRRFRIASRQWIPCSEAPRRNLKLSFGGEQLFASLSNPSPRNFATCELRVGETREPQDTLYEVLRQ